MGCEMPYLTNQGQLPPECEVRDKHGDIVSWRAVHVILFGGFDSKKADHAPWPSFGGRPPTVWRISRNPHPFEIKEYEVI